MQDNFESSSPALAAGCNELIDRAAAKKVHCVCRAQLQREYLTALQSCLLISTIISCTVCIFLASLISHCSSCIIRIELNGRENTDEPFFTFVKVSYALMAITYAVQCTSPTRSAAAIDQRRECVYQAGAMRTKSMSSQNHVASQLSVSLSLSPS